MSYAGFQRYEVPDIGGNVAKILLAQQANDAKRDALKQANALKQAKLDADKTKAQGVEEDKKDARIEKANTNRNEIFNKTPNTGYASVDGVITGTITPFVKSKALENDEKYKKGEITTAEYNLNNQALRNLPTEGKTVADN